MSSKPILPTSLTSAASRPIRARFSDSSDSEPESNTKTVKRPKTADDVSAVINNHTASSVSITDVENAGDVRAALLRPHTAPVEREQTKSGGLTIDPESPPSKSSLRAARSKSPGNEKLHAGGSTSFASPESKGPSARFMAAPEDEDRLEEVLATDRHGNYPAWLGGGTPGGNSTTSAGRLGTPTDRDGRGENNDKLYRTMQQRLEQIQLEKEAVERQLRLEIDSLKTGSMLHRQGSGNDAFFRGTSFNFEQSPPEFTIQQIHDLQNEISKLKDELSIQAARHQEILGEEKERSARNLEGAENKRRDDIRVIEMRHEEAVSALKRMHAEELAATKQRARDGMALEELSNQIRTTTGSLRLIEEHMHSQYKGLDIVKEGQFEARERVLAAAEEKSRERAELAEAEGYRLKGILVHMVRCMCANKALFWLMFC